MLVKYLVEDICFHFLGSRANPIATRVIPSYFDFPMSSRENMAITRTSRPYLPGGLLDWLAWLCATCFRASTVVAAHTGGNFCSLRSTSGLTHVAEDLSMGYHTRLRGAHESDIQKLNFGPTLTFHLFAFSFFAVFLCCRVQ